ncbi:MAG: Tlg2-vesicle protein [Watsoniomyces obsoletus]|nr:MAG: Tlg2-vesicle protein [Watsoniomyces obsoletus]
MTLETGLAQSSSPFDAVNYDPLEHLNALFSHPSTLSSVDAVCHALDDRQDELDEQIASLEEAQTRSNQHSVERIQATKDELAELFRKIDNVRERAIQTEQTITEMTADIKRLDATKRNLTLSMTALKRLQMLTTAYEQLWSMSRSREYRECAQLLQAVLQLMAYFKSYRSIDQIATLSRNVADLQRELQEQICEDFEITFAKGEVRQRKGMLGEACLVIDALGDNARSRLIMWYCNTELREYRQLFRGNEEAGSLDNISRRYSWFKRLLRMYDEEHASIFPTAWKVNEVLANTFCEGTRDDFKGILSRSVRRADGQTLDVDLLLSCLQQTLDFEQYLEQRFSDSRMSVDTLSSRDEKPRALGRVISEAFEPYLSLWVESQDRQLSTLILRYRQQPLRPPDEEFTPSTVSPSSIELFQSYRVMLAQCAKLSTGNRLLELSKIFARYLDQYAEQALLSRFSSMGATNRGSSDPPLEDIIIILNTADYCHSTSGQLEEKIRGRIQGELKSQIDLHSQQDAFMGVASAAIRTLVRMVDQNSEPAWREMRNTPWGKLESVDDQSSFVGELLWRIREKAKEILDVLVKPQYARAFCDNLVELMANTYLANILLCKPISETGAEQMLLDLYVLRKGFEELLTLNAEPGTAPPPSYIKRVTTSFTKLDPLLKTLQVRSSPPEALVQAYLIHIGDRSDTNFKKILELKGIRRSDQPSFLELFQAFKNSSSTGNANPNMVAQSGLLTPLNLPSGGSGGAGGGGGGSGGGGGPAGMMNSLATLGTAAALSTPSLQIQFQRPFAGIETPGVVGGLGLMGGVGFFGGGGSGVSGGGGVGGTRREGSNASAGSNGTGAGLGGTVSPNLNLAGFNFGGGGGGDTASGGTTTNNIQENLRSIGRFFKRDIGGGFGGRFGGGGGAGGGGQGGQGGGWSRTGSEDAGAGAGSGAGTS